MKAGEWTSPLSWREVSTTQRACPNPNSVPAEAPAGAVGVADGVGVVGVADAAGVPGAADVPALPTADPAA